MLHHIYSPQWKYLFIAPVLNCEYIKKKILITFLLIFNLYSNCNLHIELNNCKKNTENTKWIFFHSYSMQMDDNQYAKDFGRLLKYVTLEPKKNTERLLTKRWWIVN